jgi:hypothetical protein
MATCSTTQIPAPNGRRLLQHVGLGTREKIEIKEEHVWYKYRGLIVHDLRRGAAGNPRQAGVPETAAMKISGHKTRHAFERYNIVSTDDMTNAMRAVESGSLQMLTD